MSVIKKIKNSVKNSGGSREKIVRVAPDKKIRIRFLTEFDEAKEFVVHDSFERGITAICRKHYDEDCPYCDDDTVKTMNKYAWSVWDADSKSVAIFFWQATSRSPVNQLLSYYETYGTILDRDYVIERKGSRLDTTYTVIPMDKSKFRNTDAKPFSETGLKKILDKAFPPKAFKDEDYGDTDGDYDEEDVDYDDEPKKKKGKSDKDAKAAKWLESKLESEDIDEEDFLLFFDADSIEDAVKGNTKKQLMALVEEYLQNLDGEDDEDDDE